MPFTFAHSAAALPLRRLRLVPSALVVGTLAPDFEYFLRLGPAGGFGHTIPGAFLFSLPLALLVLWIFHGLVKAPLVQLFPDSVRLRLPAYGRFRFGGPGRFLLIAASALTGIATHIAWDSFTHRYTWPTRHLLLLQQTVQLPILGPLPGYKVLQHASSIAGLLILCGWLLHWYRTTPPRCDAEEALLPSARKWLVVGLIVGLALVAGMIRAAAGIDYFGFARHRETVIGDAVVTAIALAWWLLVAYAVLARRGSSRLKT